MTRIVRHTGPESRMQDKLIEKNLYILLIFFSRIENGFFPLKMCTIVLFVKRQHFHLKYTTYVRIQIEQVIKRFIFRNLVFS